MHQQSRHPARMTSPASSPQTNPTRTNNPREAVGAAARTRSGSETLAGQGGSSGGDSGEASGTRPSREAIKKLDQIVQNFHTKAAVLILQSRINVTPTSARGSEKGKTNKWFQIETDDIDDFREELKIWKSSGSYENKPPPMIIETYLDASRLSNNQSLVIVDDNGKRWDVLEALNSSESSSGGSSPSRLQRRHNEVILERWRVELRCIPTDEPDDFAPSLPTIYKRAIVFFRSLYTTVHILPMWKHSQHKIHPALEVKCRFLMGEPDHAGYDPLRQPLYDGSDVVSDYVFGDLEIPVGRFSASVTYRNDCNFRVDDSESLLSSRFMGVDEHFFKPSLPQRREHARTESYGEIGSLPSNKQSRLGQEPQQTYGSLSTFHGVGALGTSPMTALRAVRPIGSDTSSPAGSAPESSGPDPPHSLPIRPGQSSASRPFKTYEAMSRRPSVSLAINPFKNGSLSGSPKLGEGEAPGSPSHSRGQSYSGVSYPRTNRSSLTAGMAASLRGGPPPGSEQPVVGSPRPQNTSRYSSSFTHRRGRPSFGGQSKPGDDDQISSGRQSLSSSAQPGSGLLAEVGGTASSGSFQNDDDNISDFLKALDSRKTLQSFEPNRKGEASTAKRTAAQLSKFAMMRESNNALTDSITSSIHLHRSSSSSSRQLANVPSMVNPASMSASSSPSKPLSPHTPHTPAIPSRLSENSIIDYPGQRQTARRLANTDITAEEEGEGADDTPVPVSQEGTTAIDIPLSPRVLQAVDRRAASSVAHQHRSSTAGPRPSRERGDDDDVDVGFGLTQRSISLGADDREAPTMSALRALQRTANATSSSSTAGSPPGAAGSSGADNLQPAANIRPTSVRTNSSPAPDRDAGKSADSNSPGGLLSSTPYRLRYPSTTSRGGAGRSSAPPQQQATSSSSRGSFSGTGTGRFYREDGADDEPLVFAMSELERDSRRSLEDQAGRGGGSASSASASGSGPPPGVKRSFEPRGASRRGW
ncbi:autophagy-related protein 13-domain-containing protein [Coniochaeta sp. 2T2.1]|nr:autophagy-related protein 13-domain-containing protein [Coniochaeta sp. 2T2.1]